MRAIPGADPAAFVRRGINALSSRYEAIVTYEASAERMRERLPGGWGAIEALDEHRCVYRTGDDDLEWLALRIGLAGADFSVEGPPELHATLAAIARRLLAAGEAVRPRRPA